MLEVLEWFLFLLFLRCPLVAHHGCELLVADASVSVQVGLPDHLVDLLLTQVLAQRGHHLKKSMEGRGFKKIAILH